MADQVDRFLTHINANDPLQLIVRGHLYVEAELMKLLYEALPEPEAIDLTRLGFPLKVDLAIAMRLLWPNERPAYMFLNKLRNRLAHDLDAEIDRTEEVEFFHALSPAHRHALAGKGPDDYSFPDLLRRIISVLHVSIEGRLKQLIESRSELKKLHNRVEETLSRIEGRQN